MRPRRPRLCFVGPMLGSHPGRPVGQGELLAELLERDGYVVRVTSRCPARAARLADTVGSILRWSRQSDAVVVMVFSGPGFAVVDVASWLAKRLGKPLVLALHGGNLPAFARRHRGWSERVLGRGDVLVAPSDYLARPFRALGRRTRIIPNVLELERYAYRERRGSRPELLWMRAFHDLYHPELALEVLRRLQGSRRDARLTMAGQDKGVLGAVRRRADRHGLGERVRFAGFLGAAGKRREFDRHEIFVNTSRVDNMPVSLLEAAACGLPIVSTSVGGIPDLWRHEESALLVESEDAAGMTRAVVRLLEEPDLAGTLSRHGRALAERCDWRRVKGDWEALFEELLARA